MALKTTAWDSAEYLRTEEERAAYLAACMIAQQAIFEWRSLWEWYCQTLPNLSGISVAPMDRAMISSPYIRNLRLSR